MLIRNFGSFEAGVSDKTSLMNSGIYGVKRTIYIFVSRPQYEAKTYYTGKIVIKNDVHYDAEKALSHSIQLPHSRVIRSAIYFGTFTTPQLGNIRHPEAFAVLNNATTEERVSMDNESDDGRTLTLSPNIWCNYSNLSKSNACDPLLNYDNDSIINPSGYDMYTISPEYYTDYDMYLRYGDYFNMLDDPYSNRVKLLDLLDCNTKVIFMDINKYDTIRLSEFRQLPTTESICKNSFDFSDNLKSAFNTFVGQGTTFIYDSDAKGKNLDGVNFRGGSVPFGNAYHKRYLGENLSGALELFSYACKDIEKSHGHIRVLYSPMSVGDKFQIRFKDYKSSPIITPSEIKNNGEVNHNAESNTNPISTIDNGYTTESYIKDSLQQIYSDEQLYFNKEIT